MGRKVMRVPMGFDAPLNVIWEGYTIQDRLRKDFPVMSCSECDTKYNNCHEDADYCVFYNPIWRALWYYEPPTGPGYQLWETTTEGSPQSPVFATLEELAEWCEGNATTFADFTASKEEWLKMLGKDCVYHKAEGENHTLIFI